MQMWMLEHKDDEGQIVLLDGVYASEALALAWAKHDAKEWADTCVGPEAYVGPFTTEKGQPGIEAQEPDSGIRAQWSLLPVSLTTEMPEQG